MQLKINETFSNLMPPLQDMEFELLTRSILEDGCREPLVAWNGILIDGHNRYRICQEHNIPFSVKEMQFSSKGEAVTWCIRNQIGRRNLTAFQKCELALAFEDELKAEAKKRMKMGVKLSGEQAAMKGRTRSFLADLAGVSTANVDKVKKILQIADEETLRRVRKGEISIHHAYTTLYPRKDTGITPKEEITVPEIKPKKTNLTQIENAIRNLYAGVFKGEMTTNAILSELVRVTEMIEEVNSDGKKFIRAEDQ